MIFASNPNGIGRYLSVPARIASLVRAKPRAEKPMTARLFPLERQPQTRHEAARRLPRLPSLKDAQTLSGSNMRRHGCCKKVYVTNAMTHSNS